MWFESELFERNAPKGNVLRIDDSVKEFFESVLGAAGHVLGFRNPSVYERSFTAAKRSIDNIPSVIYELGGSRYKGGAPTNMGVISMTRKGEKFGVHNSSLIADAALESAITAVLGYWETTDAFMKKIEDEKVA